jgi:hypothetical protein
MGRSRPFPDRPVVCKGMASLWCSAIHDTGFLTTVTISDIKTGETIDEEHCSGISEIR